MARRDGGLGGFFSALVALLWGVVLAGGAVALGTFVARNLEVVSLSRWVSLPSFLSIPLQRQGDNAIIVTLAGVLAGFLFLFVAGYVAQALFDAARLGWVSRSLRRRARQLEDPRAVAPDAWRWFIYPRMTRLWREFARSLKEDAFLDPQTGATRRRHLATQPPEMVFSHHVLVDLPMRVEFFRHLPGILTGSGIVSTFAGILMGLTGFDPAVGADQVTRELQGLFMGVSTAFSASFFAIVTAILVTVVEKFLLHWRYAQVTAFQGMLNSQFGSGGGLAEESALRSAAPAPWDEPVERIVGALARLEPLLSRDRAEREEATTAISLGLSGMMATIDRVSDAWSAREHTQREEMRALVASLSGFARGVEGLLTRQLEVQSALATRQQESRQRLESRLETLDARLQARDGQAEGYVARLESRLDGLGERLGEVLERQLVSHDREAPVRGGELESFSARMEWLGERLGDHVDHLSGILEEDARVRREDARERGARLVSLGERLEQHLERQTRELGEESQARQEGMTTLLAGLTALGRGMEQQTALLQDETVSRRSDLAAVAAGLERVDGRLVEQLALVREESVAGRDGLAAVAAGLERVDGRLEQQTGVLSAATGIRQQGLRDFLAGIDSLGVRLDRQLALMEEELQARHEAATGVGARLTDLASGLERQIRQQNADQAVAAERHAEGVRRMEEGIGLLRGVVSRIDAGGEETRLHREQAMEAVMRLRQGVTELTGRIPASAVVSGWLRELVMENSTAAEARHARLTERMRATHGELLARVDAGVAAVEAVRIDEAGMMRLLEGVARRLEAMQGGWREGLAEVSERIVQVSAAMDGTLHELVQKVERAATSGEEGMALLFGEMGREMERMRRQIRESAGHVSVQTREWLLANGVGGEEKLKSLMQGVSEEFKSALVTLADERSQLDGDRESALMERLLSQTAEQAEGVKLAVLGELDETARQLTTHLRASGEEMLRSREETAQEVVTVISERMESAFGGVAQELAEMRKRLVAEQKAMEASLQAWVSEASRSTVEENRLLARRLQEVQSHFDERHQGVIGVIDQLGRGLERDLEQLRDGLFHKNEESSRHVEEHLTELGQLLEGVVTSLGREQSVFIEMLGERLDSLRRRLRVK
ncbi:MAG: hypothetical protein HQL95_07420 [Magnetococcales bacterium]|nr:hypothetical protein [Magnetococcales bacterium]